MWIAAESSGSSESISYSWAKPLPPPPQPTPALPPSDCAAIFPFPLLPSCETHDNRTVVTACGARTPRHFPGTSCPLPSRAAVTAVSLSRPGREEPSEPAAARGRLPFFLLPHAGHRPRAFACYSGGIWFSSTPAAPHHLLLRARSSRAMGGYDVMHLPLFFRHGRVSDGYMCVSPPDTRVLFPSLSLPGNITVDHRVLILMPTADSLQVPGIGYHHCPLLCFPQLQPLCSSCFPPTVHFPSLTHSHSAPCWLEQL
ncbi:hypothetical protein CRENBAI_026806 [Crenichthys baileyi]|uniref:Uncharacterized protein n=1 Tax=Crenichthys baileyi TaxID=28760 RepID=A0AAV9QSN6_9TELE